MTHEFLNREQLSSPVDSNNMLIVAHTMLAEIPLVDTGAYRKSFFNGLLFRGDHVTVEMHRTVTDLLAEDPRVRQSFMSGDQKCYYWSPNPGSPEERFTDHLRDQIIPQAVDELYAQHSTREFQLRQAGWVVSRLVGMQISPPDSGGESAQPWESVKLFMKAHERITFRRAPAGRALLMRAMPPQE